MRSKVYNSLPRFLYGLAPSVAMIQRIGTDYRMNSADKRMGMPEIFRGIAL
jgi:hypothetical protein